MEGIHLGLQAHQGIRIQSQAADAELPTVQCSLGLPSSPNFYLQIVFLSYTQSPDKPTEQIQAPQPLHDLYTILKNLQILVFFTFS